MLYQIVQRHLQSFCTLDPELERQLTGRKVGDTVTIAGQQLHFVAEVIDVRPATPEEQRLGSIDGAGDHAAGTSRGARVVEIAAVLASTSSALPDHYREVITLARIARLSRVEVAARMGLTEAAARNTLARALVALAEELGRRRNDESESA